MTLPVPPATEFHVQKEQAVRVPKGNNISNITISLRMCNNMEILPPVPVSGVETERGVETLFPIK